MLKIWQFLLKGARRRSNSFPIDEYGNFYQFDCFVVNADVPMLLGGNENFNSKLDLMASTEELRAKNWSVPIYYSGRHWYYFWPEGETLFTKNEVHEILFSKAKLHKLHKKFGHAEATKLYNLLKNAGEDITNADLTTLKQIGRECLPCQRYAKQPMRYMATIPEDVTFNREVVTDIMAIAGKSVLHAVCTGTRFSAASFLSDHSAETVWSTFLCMWVHPYVGAPHILRVDQGSQFISELFYRNCSSLGILVKYIPVESPNSMGIGERYHDPLRRIYKKIADDSRNLHPTLILSSAVSAMNDTMGPEGFVPTLLCIRDATQITHR